MAISFQIRGVDDIAGRISTIAKRHDVRKIDAMLAEATIEKDEAVRRTPLDTGALRRSARVSVAHSGNTVAATIQFGGESDPRFVGYALFVHENLEAHHPVGQSKFLESVLNESRTHLAERIAKRIQFTG